MKEVIARLDNPRTAGELAVAVCNESASEHESEKEGIAWLHLIMPSESFAYSGLLSSRHSWTTAAEKGGSSSKWSML
jgi:hypothetical protein